MKRQTFVLILTFLGLLLLLIPIQLTIMILLDISDVSKLFPRSISSSLVLGIGVASSALIVGFLTGIIASKLYKDNKMARIAFLGTFVIALLLSLYTTRLFIIGPSPQKVIHYTLSANEVYVNPYFGEISLPFKEKEWTKEYHLRPSGYLKREEGIVNGTSGFVFQNITSVHMGIFVYPNPNKSSKCENAHKELEKRLESEGWQSIEVPLEAIEKRSFIGRLITASMLQHDNKAVYLECSSVLNYGRLIVLYGEKEEVIELASILS